MRFATFGRNDCLENVPSCPCNVYYVHGKDILKVTV
jgi:hypothetical protein